MGSALAALSSGVPFLDRRGFREWTRRQALYGNLTIATAGAPSACAQESLREALRMEAWFSFRILKRPCLRTSLEVACYAKRWQEIEKQARASAYSSTPFCVPNTK
jgi:hypothetical protein